MIPSHTKLGSVHLFWTEQVLVEDTKLIREQLSCARNLQKTLG
jgi:hypothetical protein